MKNKKILQHAFYLVLAGLMLLLVVEGVRVQQTFYSMRRREAVSLLEIYSQKIQLQMTDTFNQAELLEKMMLIMDQEDTSWFDAGTERLLDEESNCFALLVQQDEIVKAFPQEVASYYEGRTINELPYVYSMAKVVGSLIVEGPVSMEIKGEDKSVFLFLQPCMDGEAYLGQIIVAVDSSYVLRKLNLDYFVQKGYDYELWRVEPQDGRKEVIAVSNAEVDYSDAVKAELPRPTEWNISIRPTAGWITSKQMLEITIICFIVSVVLLLLLLTVFRLLRTGRFLEKISCMDMASRMPNRRGLLMELRNWQKQKITISMIYFVYEGYNHFSQEMDTKEETAFLKDIPQKLKKYIRCQHVCARVGEANYIVALGDEISEQELADLAKGASIELMFKVGEGQQRAFLTPRYQYGYCTPQEDADQAIRRIIAMYGKHYYEESPLRKMAETCRKLANGEANVAFEEYADLQMMELSKAFNQYSKKVEQLAYTDSEFHVGNRLKFQRDANMLINYDGKRKFSVYCIDICKFSQYNELFNTKVGNEILAEFILRLERIFGTYCYRINGDVFAGIVLTEEEGERVAQRIRGMLDQPLLIENVAFDLEARIAICSYPACGKTPQELIDNLQSAMQYAKENGKMTVLCTMDSGSAIHDSLN